MTTRHNQPISNRNFRHANVLFVEDNQDHWMLMQQAMKQVLPEVQPVWVASADEAMTYLNNCLLTGADLPKLVLLDLYLPRREDGWSLMQAIKHEGSSFKQIPVVILSYSSSRDDITDSYHRGSTSYVTKPTGLDEWAEYMQTLRVYWWETVTLPSDRYMM